MINSEGKSGLVIFTMICNLGLLAFSIFLWATENVNDERLVVYSGLTILPILNIFVLSNMDNLPGLIGLYFKRKRIEEENKIKKLENQSNKEN